MTAVSTLTFSDMRIIDEALSYYEKVLRANVDALHATADEREDATMRIAQIVKIREQTATYLGQ